MSDYNHFRSNNSKLQYYPHQRDTTVNRKKCLVNLIFVNDYFAMTMDSNSILSIRTYFSICFFFGYFATWFWYKTDNLRKMKNYFSNWFVLTLFILTSTHGLPSRNPYSVALVHPPGFRIVNFVGVAWFSSLFTWLSSSPLCFCIGSCFQ
jgi:hypothetical protein